MRFLVSEVLLHGISSDRLFARTGRGAGEQAAVGGTLSNRLTQTERPIRYPGDRHVARTTTTCTFTSSEDSEKKEQIVNYARLVKNQRSKTGRGAGEQAVVRGTDADRAALQPPRIPLGP